MAADSSSLVGVCLGHRHRLTQLIARGSVCPVYSGTDEALERPIAVKVVPARAIALYRQALLDTSALSHPALIAIYDAIGEGDALYIVQELSSGEPLDEHLAAGLPTDRVLRIALDLARVVAYTHAQGIVHGDLTPRSVLVERHGVVRVNNTCLPTDAGYVAYLSEVLAATAVADATGSPALALPEPRTPAWDVWSIGALAWQFLTSTAPEGAGAGALPRRWRAEVPERVAVVVRRYAYSQFDVDEPAAGLVRELEALVAERARARPHATPATPMVLRTARVAAAEAAGRPLTGARRQAASALIGAEASTTLFTAPTEPGIADAAATRPSADFVAGGVGGVASGSIQPRLTLPSRPLDGRYAGGPLVPRWEPPAPARRPARSRLMWWLVLTALLFIFSFIIGYLLQPVSFLPH